MRKISYSLLIVYRYRRIYSFLQIIIFFECFKSWYSIKILTFHNIWL